MRSLLDLKRAGLALLMTCVAAAAPGCAASPTDDVDADESELNAPGGAEGPALFRNDFYTYLKKDGLSDEAIRQLVLLPTEAATSPKMTPNSGKPLAAIDEAFQKLHPTEFYQQGLVTPLVEKQGPGGKALETELAQNRVHIVVVPGIFGEFIPVSPFEEVFRYGGAASVAWDRKMKELEADPTKKDLIQDRQHSPATIGDVSRSMRDLVRVGSIDDASGTPLVTVTYLKPAMGSLETFGTLDENADYYLSRLEKYFRISGLPNHLYIMGYSRGTASALNLVTRAADANAPWMPNLKGVVALAGVVYGSPLADAALAPGPQRDALDLMQDFVQNKLQSCPKDASDSIGDKAKHAMLVTQNLAAWGVFSAKMLNAGRKLGNRNDDLIREGIATEKADYARVSQFVKRAIFAGTWFGDDDVNADTETEAILRLDAPVSEYCPNVERFKTTAAQVIKGVNTLTTESRLEWFRTHTLPTNIRYFAINGTMGDPTPKGARVSPLAMNRVAYDVDSLDFRNLRTNYYDMFAASGSQLQDSQVPVQRAMFWPEIHSTLNPKQKPLETYFMGTLGIHHWGLSFPRAFSTKDGKVANPFPRSTLLKAIGTFLAQIERHKKPGSSGGGGGGVTPAPAAPDAGSLLLPDGGTATTAPSPSSASEPLPSDGVNDDPSTSSSSEEPGSSEESDGTSSAATAKKKKAKADSGCNASSKSPVDHAAVFLGFLALASLVRRRRSPR